MEVRPEGEKSMHLFFFVFQLFLVGRSFAGLSRWPTRNAVMGKADVLRMRMPTSGALAPDNESCLTWVCEFLGEASVG